MMKTILKYLAVVGLLAHGAFAAGTWVSVPLPPAVTATTRIQDCESDSKGNIWYTVTFGGLHSQSADGTAWTKYPGVPVADSSAYMGIYIDQSTDSVFVGSIRGTVQAGKNGVFHSLPSVPLTVRGGSQYTSTRVKDLYRDANGYLTAVTDSMVWWLDGNTWKIIGEKSDYLYLSLGVGKVLPNGDFGTYSHIIHADRTVTKINGFDGQGFSVGPSGTVYAGFGGFDQELVYSKPPYTKVDTLRPIQPGEQLGSKSIYAVFEDNDGWLWIPQEGRILFVKDNAVRYVMSDPLFTSYGLPRKFVMTPDSTLWMCAASYLYRYSEKYKVPQVVLDSYSSSLQGKVQSVPGISLTKHANGVTLNLIQPEVWQTRIVSAQGRLIWSGNVQGSTQVLLEPGLWVVIAKGPKGHSFKQTIAIVH